MDPITLAAIMGGGGLLKGLLVDEPKADRQRTLAAATQKFSPWTGLQAQPVKEADPFGQALQFGATGAMMGAGMKNMDAQSQWLKGGGSLAGLGSTADQYTMPQLSWMRQ